MKMALFAQTAPPTDPYADLSRNQCRRRCLALRAALLATLLLAPAHGVTTAGGRGPAVETVRNGLQAPASDCAAPAEIVATAERLRAQWKIEALNEAVRQYQVALRCWRESGDASMESATLLNIGEVSSTLSNYPQARETYSEALQLSRRHKDFTRVLEALNGLGLVSIRLSEFEKASLYGNEALTLSRRLGDKRAEAYALNNIGFAQYFHGNLKEALQTFNQALIIARGLDDKILSANVLLNLGYTNSDAGELEEALKFYHQALPLWQAEHHQRGLSRTLTAIGGADIALGRIQEGLDRHRQALTIAEEMGDSDGQGIIRNSIGYAYQLVGDDERALDLYLQALDHFTASRNPAGEAQTSEFVGDAYKRLGNNPKAIEYYQRCLAMSREMKDQQLEALALNSLGTISEITGPATDSLSNFNRALFLYRAAGNPRGEIVTLNNLGQYHAALGAKEKALRFYLQSLPLALASGDRALEVVTRGRLAELRRDTGRLDEARSQLEASLKTIETVRTKVISPELRTSYLAATRQHYELYVDVLMQLNRARPGGGLDAAAFSANEFARARNLLDMLNEAHADIREGIAPGLLAQERSLQSDLDQLAARQMQSLASQHTVEQADSLEKEIRSLGSEFEELEARIREQSPRYAELMRPQPVSLEEIQRQVLDDQTLLLEYALGDERSYLWAATRNSVQSYELPGRAEIEQATSAVHDSLIANQPVINETFADRQARVVTANNQLPSQIANLSRILLGPVAASLGTRRLLIVPDGPLQYVPFQILNSENARPLVWDHEIVYEPSASALALLIKESRTRSRGSKSVAVLADPVFEADDPRIAQPAKPAGPAKPSEMTELQPALRDVNFSAYGGHIPRLQASRDEAEAIMSLTPWRSGFQATGFAANRSTAMSEALGDYRIVHFATHGLLNNNHPELSCIVLSMFDEHGQPQDGFLRLHDIYNLRLPVDLVVLSACDTGLGKDVKGEGLIGLTRGFMYAGASSVVASLWKVDDEATAELMRLFYGYMLRDGLSPAAALRKSQVSMSQQKRWQSPYYWAGFVIQGQYLQTERVSRFPVTHPIIWLLGALLLIVAAIFAFKQRRKIRG